MIVEFDEDVARLSHQEFVKSYLLALGVRGVVVGFDYRYVIKVWATARRLKPIRTGLSKLPSSTKSNMIIKTRIDFDCRYLNEGKIEDVTALWDGFTKSKDKSSQEAKSVATQHPDCKLAIRPDFAPLRSGVYATHRRV